MPVSGSGGVPVGIAMRRTLHALAVLAALSGCMSAREETTSAIASPFASAGPDRIRTHATEGCMAVQGEMEGVPRDLMRDRCSCYARRTVARMTEEEIASYRLTGLFDETTRNKAFESLDACGLRRPA